MGPICVKCCISISFHTLRTNAHFAVAEFKAASHKACEEGPFRGSGVNSVPFMTCSKCLTLSLRQPKQSSSMETRWGFKASAAAAERSLLVTDQPQTRVSNTRGLKVSKEMRFCSYEHPQVIVGAKESLCELKLNLHYDFTSAKCLITQMNILVTVS